MMDKLAEELLEARSKKLIHLKYNPDDTISILFFHNYPDEKIKLLVHRFMTVFNLMVQIEYIEIFGTLEKTMKIDVSPVILHNWCQ